MKKVLLLLLLVTGYVMAQNYPVVPLDSVNFIPMDSLKIADSLFAAGVTPRASLTNGNYLGDTITITGILTTDTRVIRNVNTHFSFYIQNPNGPEWGGMNIYTRDTSAAVLNAGFGAIDSGYVIRVTGVLTKYQTDVWGNFELMPIGSASVTPIPINILDAGGNRPGPVEVKVSDLVKGDNSSTGKTPDATVYFDTGLKYKNSYVILRNLIVKSRTQSSSSGMWYVSLQDSAGNTISLYDISKYFSGRFAYGDTIVNGPNRYIPPAPGSKLKYVRGILACYSSYGYEIVPLYPGDVAIDAYTPSITATGFSARRSAAFPKPSDQVAVEIIAKDLDPHASSTAIDSAAVYYSVNGDTYLRLKMTALDVADTSFTGSIPPQSDGSLVKYFYKAWQYDSLGNAMESITPDTSKAPLFYYVKANAYTIKDVQYTPFRDGNSGVADLSVTVQGTVQADTSDYPAEIDRENQSTKTSNVFIQDAAAPWSGIMLYDTTANKLQKGQKVSVTGTVSMYNGMTEISVDNYNVLSSGNQMYAPVKLNTGDIGQRSNGDSLARQWQSVLVQYDSVYITDNNPDSSGSYSIWLPQGSFREYYVSDGSGDTRVDDDGSNTYSVDPNDTLYGFHIMPTGAFIRSLVGIIKYKNSEYKLEPRTNADFVGVVDAIRRENTPVPSSFSLSQNYPNPFNPATTIRYSIASPGNVALKIYNVLGQEVTTLVNQRQTAGNYIVTFDASRFASGVYLYRLSAGSYNSVRKMVLLK
ncbi:MAG: T9SS type A sorting domain-containing protein [Bacteroidetes bacterium]|nr:T9SS type A sorting domain-containing protein [Bacteroidota bacterium]